MIKVILLGYMGSGKSTIGKLVGEATGIPFIDLDSQIEKELNCSVTSIFESKGELFFRKIEHQIMCQIMQTNQSVILSLGGGTPCYYSNHELFLGENVIAIYLKASIETLLERISSSNSNRPLLANKTDEEQKEFIAKHLFDRSYYYYQAQYRVVVDAKSPEQIVAEILAILA